MRHRPTLALVVMAALVALAIGRSEGAMPGYRIIVNAANPTGPVERKFLTDAFLKRTTRWPGGQQIRPVDLGSESPVRRRFSEDVLNRTVAAVKSYWQQMIFSGRAIPPPELESDEEVVRYVAKHPGGVGYVSTAGELAGVKVVSFK